MARLPKVPCSGPPYQAALMGANSVLIRDQSHSSSSASSMAMEVSVPCPLSGLWMISVTTSSAPIRTNALGTIAPPPGGPNCASTIAAPPSGR
jgi:hypothetical protein